MKSIVRLFSTEQVKGTKNYLDSQKKYECIRTMLYFGISASLFVAGIIATGSKTNLLTIVAVLGCLPASKSLVNMIMYLRYHSLKQEDAIAIEECSEVSHVLYDMVFTSYDKNYVVEHMSIVGNTICGYTGVKEFKEQDFYKHIDSILKKENLKNVNIKVFTDLTKYLERIQQMNFLEKNDNLSEDMLRVLKSVSL